MNKRVLALIISLVPGVLFLLGNESPALARVTRIEITQRKPWLGGASVGAAGAYELLSGRVHYAVDPDEPANQGIVDLGRVPRNEAGNVEFSGDFRLLRPVDPARARGTVLLEIPNRGGTQLSGLFFRLPAGRLNLRDPAKVTRLDDAFLFDRGFIVAWVGWQFDVPESVGLRLDVPTADVDGLVRRTFVGPAAGSLRLLPITVPGGYPAAAPEQPDAVMTMRSRFDAPAVVVPRETWSFGREDSGRFVPDPRHITLSRPLETRQIYEVVYRAHGSPVAGLGFAAVRDFAAYLKHGGAEQALRENPGTLARVLGYGYSQSARFLRSFVYEGFNADELGRPVFDGLFVASAGAGRGNFNQRFALPGVAGNSVLSIMEPVDVFPFTDFTQEDPVTHRSDGLLTRAEGQNAVPKIFHTYSSTEYWARVGSLAHTSVDGARDVTLHPATRLYFIAGTPHSMGPMPPQRTRPGSPVPGQPSLGAAANYDYSLNPVWAWPAFHALLLALDDWVHRGNEPPPSTYPTLRAQGLVSVEQARFPKIPGIEFPRYMPRIWRMDFGPDFERTGIAASPRPAIGAAYTVLVPSVDADGNEPWGIRLPHVAVPLGVYTGWNYTIPRYDNLDYLAGLQGAFIPFARSRSERLANGDPRRSVAERYSSRSGYLLRVRSTALSLAKRGYVRGEDVEQVVLESGRMWDFVMQPQEGGDRTR